MGGKLNLREVAAIKEQPKPIRDAHNKKGGGERDKRLEGLPPKEDDRATRGASRSVEMERASARCEAGDGVVGAAKSDQKTRLRESGRQDWGG